MYLIYLDIKCFEKKRETKAEKLCHNKNCGWILWWIPGVILEWQKKIGHLLSQHLPLFSTKCTKYTFWKLHKIHVLWPTIADIDFHLNEVALTANFWFWRKVRVCFIWAAWIENIFLQLFTQFNSLGFGPTFIWCHGIVWWKFLSCGQT